MNSVTYAAYIVSIDKLLAILVSIFTRYNNSYNYVNYCLVWTKQKTRWDEKNQNWIKSNEMKRLTKKDEKYSVNSNSQPNNKCEWKLYRRLTLTHQIIVKAAREKVVRWMILNKMIEVKVQTKTRTRENDAFNNFEPVKGLLNGRDVREF
jgi:hypothetical protein